jgi:Ca-activated chloride channel family protein
MNFAHPGWLALLILLPLMAVAAVLTFRLRRKQWSAFVAPRLRDSLLKRGSLVPRWLAVFFLLGGCATLIVALARPRADAGTKTEKTLGRNVMIALDISRSMRVADVKPDRLTQAKVIIYELLEALPNERIGFIGFAGNAYPYAPLTIDHSAVREITEQIDEKWAPLGGSNLPAAVHLAVETLKKTGQKNNALVILSDGEEVKDGSGGSELESMIAEAERAGVFVVTIGVGTEEGGIVPNPEFPNGKMTDRSGAPIVSRLRPETLRNLAQETKGRFTIANSGQNIPALVTSVVSGLDAFEMEGRERRISIEFYQWLVLPAILFLMLSIIAGTRWKGIRTVVTAAALGACFIQPAPASEATQAMQELEGQHYKEARESYNKLAAESRMAETKARYRLGEGTAAYRGGDFREARTAFSRALLSRNADVQASGHLGIGNTLFQLGWQGLSGESYPTDPSAIPDLDRFTTIVKEALAKMRESDSPDESDSQDFVKMQTLITNWADAVRHYDSAREVAPPNKIAQANRDLTVTYLKRLQELLDEEQQNAQQSMPQGEPGQGPPQEGKDGEEGDGQPKEGQNGKSGKKPKNQGENGDKKDKDGSGEDGDKKDKDGKKGKEKEKKPGDKGANPNETPQERAKRILSENADLEKGPLSPGRREYRNAEKDW